MVLCDMRKSVHAYKINVVNKLLVHCWVSGALSPFLCA